MAEAKRQKALVRRAFHFGNKRIQVGKFKGAVQVGFVSVSSGVAQAMGLELTLPKDVPGTTYSIEHGMIFDTHTSKGVKVKSPVKAQVGAKKVTVTFVNAGFSGISPRKVSGPKGAKTKPLATSNKVSAQIGVPVWANVRLMQKFLRKTKVESFSFGGQQYRVNKKEEA